MPKPIPVVFRGTVYPSLSAWARDNEVSDRRLRYWREVMREDFGPEDLEYLVDSCSSHAKPVTIRGVEYASMTIAAKALDVCWATVYRHNRNGTLDKVGVRKRNPNRVYTRRSHEANV